MNVNFDPWKLEDDDDEESGAENTGLSYRPGSVDPRPTSPIGEKTLEQVLATGKTTHDMEQSYKSITLRACPAWLLAVVHALAQKMRAPAGKKRSEAEVFRLLIKLGASELAALNSVQVLGGRAASVSRPYTLQQGKFRTPGRRWHPSVFGRDHTLLTGLARILGLPRDEVAALALIAAFRISEWVVADPVFDVCHTEFMTFWGYIIEESRGSPRDRPVGSGG